jgi:hypothetical protein
MPTGYAQQMQDAACRYNTIASDSVSTGELRPPNRKVLRDLESI